MAKKQSSTSKASRRRQSKQTESTKVKVKTSQAKSRLQQLDIANLPAAEDERTEFKSSKTAPEALKEKLARAASAFWNSGGGLFVAGVNDQGKPDGGLLPSVGRTSIRDWIDQVVNRVSPVGSYGIRLFRHSHSSGLDIDAGKCVIAIEFFNSDRPPHMAPDHKYYIRAGAHTESASHFIVEALWARRRMQRPQLAHAMRTKPEASDIIQLSIVALNDEPAVSVTVSLDPLPELWKDSVDVFPLRLPVLDKTTPFHLDVTTFVLAETRLGPSVRLRVEYDDVAGNHYEYTAILDVRSIAPWTLGTPASERSAKALESVEKSLRQIPKEIRELREEGSQLRSRLEALQFTAFPQAESVPHELVARLSPDAQRLLIAARTQGTIFFGVGRLHAGQTHFTSNRNDPREDAKWASTLFAMKGLGLIDGVLDKRHTSLLRLTDLGFQVADVLAKNLSNETQNEES